jgi:hypothetical protein
MLREKCLLFVVRRNITTNIIKIPNINFTKICTVGVALIHADRRTDGHDEVNG